MRKWLPLSVVATLLLVNCVNSCQSGSKLTVAPEGFVITSSESQTVELTSDRTSVVQFEARQTAITSVAIHAMGRDNDEFVPAVRQPAPHPHFHTIVGDEVLAVEPGRVGLRPPRDFLRDAGLQQ